MKIILKLASLLTCIAIAFGISASGLFAMTDKDSGNIDVLSDYSFDELKGATDLPHFRNKAQFLSLIRSAYFITTPVYGGMLKGDGLVYYEESSDALSVTGAEAPSMAPEADTGATSVPSSENELTDVSSTNLQTEGVDEGDIIKTDGKYIYVISGAKMRIFDISEKSFIADYTFASDKLQSNIDSLYVKGDTVILIGSYTEYYDKDGSILTPEKEEMTEFGKPLGGERVYEPNGSDSYDVYDIYDKYNSYSSKYFTCAEIVDISEPSEISLKRSVAYEGSLISSREVNGKLVLAVNKSFGYFYGVYPEYDDVVPELYDTATEDLVISPKDIIRAPGSLKTNIMTLASIEYETSEPAEMLEILGWGNDIYMTSDNLYIFGSEYTPFSGSCTTIVKYSISDGLVYKANAKVKGNVSTPFSYNEYKGEFRIATTVSPSYNTTDTYKVNTNSVYKLDSNLSLIGKLDGIAPDESIKSARFMGDTLYLVTFRQTDPLFCIDLSEKTPVMLGELKVPGFSTYLHQVADGLLLGIGYSTVEHSETYNGYTTSWTTTNGVKVSLFDVSDLTAPVEADVVEMLGGEYSSSEAQNNYHAFTWSESASTAYIPMRFDLPYSDSNKYVNSECGYAAIKVTDDGKLDIKLVAARDYSDSSSYSYDNRICYIADELYLYTGSSLILFDRSENVQIAVYTID